MVAITITKDDTGALVGFSRDDKRAYSRFTKILNDLEIGELLELRYFFKRDLRFHRKHMGLLRVFFESQEVFDNYDRFRDWTEVGAGHVNWIPGPDGVMQAIPKSISFAEIDDEEMRVVHEATKVFFRTERAQVTMWPNLDPGIRAAGAEGLLTYFEKDFT